MRSIAFIMLVFAVGGCARRKPPFTLTAKFETQDSSSALLRITLHNVSNKPQSIRVFTNYFAGSIYLHASSSEGREFIQSNHWVASVSAFRFKPALDLPPAGSHRFEHQVSEFIELAQMSYTPSNPPWCVSFPILAEEWTHGGEISCALDIYHPTGKKIVTVVSKNIKGQ